MVCRPLNFSQRRPRRRTTCPTQGKIEGAVKGGILFGALAWRIRQVPQAARRRRMMPDWREAVAIVLELDPQEIGLGEQISRDEVDDRRPSRAAG